MHILDSFGIHIVNTKQPLGKHEPRQPDELDYFLKNIT